jgi:hypothetical protein
LKKEKGETTFHFPSSLFKLLQVIRVVIILMLNK